MSKGLGLQKFSETTGVITFKTLIGHFVLVMLDL